MNIAKLLTPRNIALAEELGASVKSSPTMMALVNDLDGMSANEAYIGISVSSTARSSCSRIAARIAAHRRAFGGRSVACWARMSSSTPFSVRRRTGMGMYETSATA